MSLTLSLYLKYAQGYKFDFIQPYPRVYSRRVFEEAGGGGLFEYLEYPFNIYYPYPHKCVTTSLAFLNVEFFFHEQLVIIHTVSYFLFFLKIYNFQQAMHLLSETFEPVRQLFMKANFYFKRFSEGMAQWDN